MLPPAPPYILTSITYLTHDLRGYTAPFACRGQIVVLRGVESARGFDRPAPLYGVTSPADGTGSPDEGVIWEFS